MKLRGSGIVAFGLSLVACAGSSTTTARLEIVVIGNGVTSPPAGAHEYASGTRVAVTATPTGGASFAGWSGVVSALESPVEVIVGGEATLVAHFSGGAPGTGSSGASGGGSSGSSGASSSGGSSGSSGAPSSGGSSSSGAVSSGGSSSSGAASSGGTPGGGLSSSSGAASIGGGASGGVSSSGSSGVSSSGSTARFVLTVNVAGTGGGVVSGTGVECGATCTASYAADANVTLSAAATSGSTFSSWSGACTGAASTCTVSMTADQAVTATFSGAQSSPFANPVFWEDLPDPDVLRVDDTYYALGSSFHFSPGAPILRSYDLVNWEPAGHAVSVLDVSPSYDLSGGRAYVKGIGASFLDYRKSNTTFYWGGCIGPGKTYIYTAASVEGPWQRGGVIDGCYVDPSLLIDDDDKMYVAYGSTTLSVAELTADGFGQVRTQQVFTAPFAVQGARFHKVNGSYYILVSRPASGEYVLRSTTGPFGPYTMQALVDGVGAPVSGGGAPYQGGIVQTQSGAWYYLASMEAYPGGRFPILAPVTWGADGWPAVQLVNGAWGATYPSPRVPAAPRATRPLTGIDRFTGPALGPDWEWNHNPDGTRWSFQDGLRLQTATVTTDLYSARNTLTHRILGPTSTATILLDYTGMRDGDRAGLVLLRDTSAWVGVLRDGGATRVAMMHGLTMDGSWNTTGTGGEVSNAPVSGGTIWLRASADITPGAQQQARFSYSTDGVTFTQIGTPFAMVGASQYLLGYRFGLFNYANQALGGVVTVRSFELAVP